jgi:hypothetical protein
VDGNAKRDISGRGGSILITSGQLVLRHPRRGERIADGVLRRPAWLAGDLQQSTMISGVEYRELRTTLQLFTGPVAFTVLQQHEDPSVKLWNKAFKRRLHV